MANTDKVVSPEQFLKDRMREATHGLDKAAPEGNYSVIHAAMQVHSLPVMCQCPQCGLHITLSEGRDLYQDLQKQHVGGTESDPAPNRHD